VWLAVARPLAVVLPEFGSEPQPNLNRTRTEPELGFEVRAFSVFAEPVRTGSNLNSLGVKKTSKNFISGQVLPVFRDKNRPTEELQAWVLRNYHTMA
jgi:hypothetical protein